MAHAWSILGELSQQHRSAHWPHWRLVETHWVPIWSWGLSALGMALPGMWRSYSQRSTVPCSRAQPEADLQVR